MFGEVAREESLFRSGEGGGGGGHQELEKRGDQDLERGGGHQELEKGGGRRLSRS